MGDSPVVRQPIGFWKKSLFTAIVLLGVSLSAELGLRIAGYKPIINNKLTIGEGRKLIRDPYPGVPFMYAPNSTVELTWSSNPRGYFDSPKNSLTFQLNNSGFRGKDLVRGKSPAVRTIILGDSLAWGWGVKDDEILTAQLARLLDQSTLTGRPVEFANLSAPAFDTPSEVALLEHVGLALEPDVAVIWFFLNDFGTTVTIASLGENDRFRRVRRLSRLLDVVLAPIDGVLGQSELVATYRAAYVDGEPGWEGIKRAIARFGAICREHGIVPVLAVHPVLMSLDDYPFEMVHRRVLDTAKQNGVVGIDLLPAFAGRRAADLWVHPADQHPNEIAQRLTAELVAPPLARLIATAAGRRQP